jgi:hypothetical protein
MMRTHALGWSLAVLCATFLHQLPAWANPTILGQWQFRYGVNSPSLVNAASSFLGNCALCHYSASQAQLMAGTDVRWNGYGSFLKQHSLNFATAETVDSDGDPMGTTNLQEIQAGTQPGWRAGNNNIYSATGAVLASNVAAPAGISGNLDPLPLPALSINSITAPEGNSGTTPFVFTVTLSAPSALTVTVNFATADATATAGSDYMATSGTLTFTPGQTSRTITVNVNGDTAVEPTESFVVNLSAPTNATIAVAQGVGTIINDDVDAPTNNFEGLWWNSPGGSESGWGINFAHQGDVIFASWFTYDLARKGWWLVMAAFNTGGNTFSGTLYQATGPPFDAVPFPPLGTPGGATAAAVGTGTLTFTDSNNATFAYTVNGISQIKSITREMIGLGPLPTCTFSPQNNLVAATNYQDLWWAAPAGFEDGWGINLTHNGAIIFGTWFTYDHDRTPMWLVVTAPRTGPTTYAGDLLRTTGPPFNSVPFPPIGSPGGATGTKVGTATFTFSDGNTGTFAYSVNGVSQTKAITREVFRPPGTVCQ